MSYTNHQFHGGKTMNAEAKIYHYWLNQQGFDMAAPAPKKEKKKKWVYNPFKAKAKEAKEAV
jgi:hypothetical protein